MFTHACCLSGVLVIPGRPIQMVAMVLSYAKLPLRRRIVHKPALHSQWKLQVRTSYLEVRYSNDPSCGDVKRLDFHNSVRRGRQRTIYVFYSGVLWEPSAQRFERWEGSGEWPRDFENGVLWVYFQCIPSVFLGVGAPEFGGWLIGLVVVHRLHMQ